MTDICIIGDSIAKGIIFDDIRQKYSVLGENFVAILQHELGAKINNFASFGATTNKGCKILERHYSDIKKYKYTLIEFGGNDCNFDWRKVSAAPECIHLAEIPIKKFKSHYEEIIEKTIAAGSRPILLTLPPLDGSRFFTWISKDLNGRNILKFLGGDVSSIEEWQSAYNDMVVNLAEEYGIQLIDIRRPFMELEDYSEYICIDGMHPNKKGHRLIADFLKAELSKLD